MTLLTDSSVCALFELQLGLGVDLGVWGTASVDVFDRNLDLTVPESDEDELGGDGSGWPEGLALGLRGCFLSLGRLWDREAREHV